MTVRVTVKIYAYVPDYDGPREINTDVPEDVGEAVSWLLAGPCAALREGFGVDFRLLVNGRSYHLVLAERRKLRDGDALAFVSILCGG